MPDLKQTIKVDMKGVAKVKANLKELEKRTRKLESAGKSSSETNKKAGASLKSMALAVGGSTVAIMALSKAFKAIVGKGKEFEQSMANVKAISGASGTEFRALEENAKNLGATTVHTASAVAGLQTEFAKLGFTAKEITQVTGATLALASATGSDLALSASVAGETLRGFGMDVSETTTVTDVMALSFSSSALDMQKFSDSMSYVAPVAKMAGFGIEGTTAMLGQLANAGISGSMAGTALRKIFLELSNESSKLSERLGGSVTSVDELIPALKRLNAEGVSTAEMKDLVGQRAISAFSILLEGSDDVNTLSEALNNAGGSAQRMADIQLNTLEGRMTLLGSATDGLALSLFDHLAPGLNSAAESAIEFVNTLNSFIAIPASEKMREENAELNSMFGILMDVNSLQDTRNRAIEKLQAEYPDYIKNIDFETAGYEDLKIALENANAEFKKQIDLQVSNEILQKAREDLKNANIALFKSQDKLNQAIEREANEGWLDKIAFSMDNLYENSGVLSFQTAVLRKEVTLAEAEYARLQEQLVEQGFVTDEATKGYQALGQTFADEGTAVKDFSDTLEFVAKTYESSTENQIIMTEKQILLTEARLADIDAMALEMGMTNEMSVSYEILIAQIGELKAKIEEVSAPEDGALKALGFSEDNMAVAEERVAEFYTQMGESTLETKLLEQELAEAQVIAHLEEIRGFEGASKKELLKIEEHFAGKKKEIRDADAAEQKAKIMEAATTSLAVAGDMFGKMAAIKEKDIAIEKKRLMDVLANDKEKMKSSGATNKEIADFEKKRLGEIDNALKDANKNAQDMRYRQAQFAAFEAAINAYNSLVGTPFVGPVIAPIAAAVALSFGLKQAAQIRAAQTGMDEIVTRPTQILTGEGGTAERVQVTPIGDDEITGGGGGSPINISFSGNVMSQDFIEDEAIPMIREALRRGEDMGIA